MTEWTQSITNLKFNVQKENKMDFQSINCAFEYIKKLKTNGRSNIALTEDYNSIKISRFDAFKFYITEDGCLNLYNGQGMVMPKKELENIIDFLNFTLANYNEEESVKKEIEEIEVWIQNNTKSNKEYKEVNKKVLKSVYLIRGENGRYKIGYSKNANDRVASLKLSSCENHELIYSFKTYSAYKTEQELHEKFKHKRIHSEWFELTNEDVEYIKGFKDEI